MRPPSEGSSRLDFALQLLVVAYFALAAGMTCQAERVLEQAPDRGRASPAEPAQPGVPIQEEPGATRGPSGHGAPERPA